MDQCESESNTGAECDEDASEGPDQEVLRKIPIIEFIRPHNTLGGNEKSKGRVASRSNYNRQNNAF